MARDEELEILRVHSAHDPAAMSGRWRAVAKRVGLSMDAFASAGEHELFVLRSASPAGGARRVYLSSGVHGDEPGAALGLLEWAEANAAALRDFDLLIFPLMNPWGLQNNIRHDERGRDLNRLFHSRANPFPAWRRELGRERFDLAICLHEDFDAHGCYIYELGVAGIAERLLAAGSPFVPPDPRDEIETSVAKGGVIRHGDLKREDFPLKGLPETVWLYFERCPCSLTIETPSELSLYDRVRAHGAMLSEALFGAL